MVIGFNTPITETNKELIGVLTTRVSMDNIIERVRVLGERSVGDNNAYLLNKRGEILVGPDEKEFLTTHRLHEFPVVKDLLAGKTGITEYENDRGENFISARYALKGDGDFNGWGWGIMLTEPFSETFEAAYIIRNTMITLVLVIAFLVTILAIPISKRFSRPIKEVSESALRISRGDLEPIKITYGPKDEIGDLFGAFNKMAEDLHATTVSRDSLIKEIAERKRAEESMRETEEKFKSLSETADIICTLGVDGSLTYVNPAWEKTLGHKREEVIGKYFVDFAKEEDAREHTQFFEKIRDGKETVRDSIITLIHKGGSARLFNVCGSPNLDPEGRLTGAVGLLKDITEHRKLEVQLQRAQRMQAVGTLAGGVAHELNNVLSGLVSYPELILMDLPEDSNLRTPILTMQKSGQKAAAIVQDLLTLARRGVAVTEVLNLNLIISGYVKSPEHEKLKSSHPNVQLETNLETDLLNILGSPAHLSKTVMNLVYNAAETIPDRGKILISTENRYIDSPIRGYDNVKEGDYIILTVSDNGVGISSEDMERIFEPFYTKKVMGRSATGLGMAVVWGTVKDHRGYIDIQSTQGKGTTFTLYFPVTRKDVAKDKSSLSIENYMGKGESILVVDDVKGQREIASRILKKLGYSVTSASSGEEAIDYLKDNSADLLVLDMIMDPGIDGLDTYKRIIEFHPGQKAIIVSGFSETEHVKEAQRLGAGAYVKKPYLLEKIGLTVRDELGR